MTSKVSSSRPHSDSAISISTIDFHADQAIDTGLFAGFSFRPAFRVYRSLTTYRSLDGSQIRSSGIITVGGNYHKSEYVPGIYTQPLVLRISSLA